MSPSTLLKAIEDGEAAIKRLEAELRKEEEEAAKALPGHPSSGFAADLKDLLRYAEV